MYLYLDNTLTIPYLRQLTAVSLAKTSYGSCLRHIVCAKLCEARDLRVLSVRSRLHEAVCVKPQRPSPIPPCQILRTCLSSTYVSCRRLALILSAEPLRPDPTRPEPTPRRVGPRAEIMRTEPGQGERNPPRRDKPASRHASQPASIRQAKLVVQILRLVPRIGCSTVLTRPKPKIVATDFNVANRR